MGGMRRGGLVLLCSIRENEPKGQGGFGILLGKESWGDLSKSANKENGELKSASLLSRGSG